MWRHHSTTRSLRVVSNALEHGLVSIPWIAWRWLAHTFHATRFDQDLPRQRLLGFLQVGAVALIGDGASAPLA